MLDGVLEFIELLMDTIYNAYETVTLAATTIGDFDFGSSPIPLYMGYARYAMGDPLYIMFTSVCIISLGFQMWSLVLKAVQLIKEVCFK